jgi:casein kinase II subunit beta
VLPLGLSDQPYQYAVSTFCPRCREVYYPKRLNSVDGAFFGTTFAHLFLMVYPELVPPKYDL